MKTLIISILLTFVASPAFAQLGPYLDNSPYGGPYDGNGFVMNPQCDPTSCYDAKEVNFILVGAVAVESLGDFVQVTPSGIGVGRGHQFVFAFMGAPNGCTLEDVIHAEGGNVIYYYPDGHQDAGIWAEAWCYGLSCDSGIGLGNFVLMGLTPLDAWGDGSC